MKRRDFLRLTGAGLLAATLPWPARAAQAFRHCRPGDPDWPDDPTWQRLQNSLKGRLLRPVSPPEPIQNPFAREDQAGATQSAGWERAWTSTPSAAAVAAESTADVVAAVNFARERRLRLIVKGTGHDYLGRSCAPDSLLVWTHPMRSTTLHKDFRPAGAPPSVAGVNALSVQAGTRWLEAYHEVTGMAGRYVQGGGCASVGVAGGFTQGGGFGSFSKKFGTGAAGMLEVEVVTSDGQVRIANAWQHTDLFWALRGGGGGTFGIVTRMTLATHPLPATFGLLRGRLKAASEADFRRLVERFCRFYLDHLHNEHWGEQFALRPDNSIELYLVFQGLERPEVEALWAPLQGWPGATLEKEIIAFPAREMWNVEYWLQHHPDMVCPDGGFRYWWAGNTAEVGMYWQAYQSRWVPPALFETPHALFEASRHWTVSVHVNKGLAGASPETLARCRETSLNPVACEAAALIIAAAGGRSEPEKAARVSAAMSIVRAATPRMGAYANEADYFEKDWQHEFYGAHYSRLLEVKRRYDPHDLFHCHHGVGSEGWSPDQMTRL